MIIYIGADHQGFQLKEAVKNFLKDRGYQVQDTGDARYDEQDDYPDFASALAMKVSGDYEQSRGVLVCGSGVGMDIVANKFRHIRAALATSSDQAYDARNDDDTNVLVLSSRYVTSDAARKILVTWLETPFSREPRYLRRIEKINKIEETLMKDVSFEDDGRGEPIAPERPPLSWK